ncbi:three-helix bundle dimerization domain-containing protein, partial [Mycolicibacterium gadium]|uniref:three-helix bundle dimerization domain-containing protein n=2 Tax=Mycolicibacterium TaxID=1866885 RepID=UPI0021F31363
VKLTTPLRWLRVNIVGNVSEDMLIEQVIDRLAATYCDVPRDDVAHAVANAHNHFQDSTIREFVPLLVERRARKELARSDSLLVWSS